MELEYIQNKALLLGETEIYESGKYTVSVDICKKDRFWGRANLNWGSVLICPKDYPDTGCGTVFSGFIFDTRTIYLYYNSNMIYTADGSGLRDGIKCTDVNRQSPEEYREIRDLALFIDSAIRERFPGYALFPREDDPCMMSLPWWNRFDQMIGKLSDIQLLLKHQEMMLRKLNVFDPMLDKRWMYDDKVRSRISEEVHEKNLWMFYDNADRKRKSLLAEFSIDDIFPLTEKRH